MIPQYTLETVFPDVSPATTATPSYDAIVKTLEDRVAQISALLSPGDEQKLSIPQQVYNYLVVAEDFDAEHESRYVQTVDHWASLAWADSCPEWQNLFAAAWLEPTPDEDPGPQYFRPSLWLLDDEWKAKNGFTAFGIQHVASVVFR